MKRMSFKEQRRLYEMIEKAVAEKTPIIFPEGLHPFLQVDSTPTGPLFKIPNLLWRDKKRNLYRAWMQMRYRSKDICSSGLYVVGSVTLDGSSSDDISMFRKENRYFIVL